MPQLTSEPVEATQERKMTRGAIGKRKLKLRQVKVPNALDAEIVKAADEFGYDGASALIRDAIVKHLQHLRKTTPDSRENWIRNESERNRRAIRGVYSSMRLITAAVAVLGRYQFLRHGDPEPDELEANRLQIEGFDRQFQDDVSRVYKQDTEFWRDISLDDEETEAAKCL